jgi:Rne/Rng family ribonuclease
LDRELLIAAGPGEWRAALLEDGVPVELFVERGDHSQAGSIHLGRVCRLLPALGAVLVDIGDKRPAFLPQSAVTPHGARLHEGERVVVQVRREAQGGKAARVTMALTLRGDHIELIIGRPGIKGGATLSPEEQARLLSTGARVPPTPRARGVGRGEGQLQIGFRVVEPAAIDALAAESLALAQRWRDIEDRASQLNPPARIAPVASFAAALAGALVGTPQRVFVDDPAAIPELRAAFAASAVEHHREAEWSADLDDLFAGALAETVALRGGGSVHFEATRAGMLIDVDSGTPETGSPDRVGLATNLAAAGEIARQIRLRNLGGGIVIDFVGLDSRSLRERVRGALAEALGADPASPRILGWTRLGHLELVRPRRARPLAEVLLEPRPGGAAVKTAVTVAYEALRTLRREARTEPGRSWRLTVSPNVAAALSGGAARAVRDAEQRFARNIAIEPDIAYDQERFQIAPV